MRHLFFVLLAGVTGCAAGPRNVSSTSEFASTSEQAGASSESSVEPPARPEGRCDDDCLKEHYGFSIGLQAYLYGYPLVITDVYRRVMQASTAKRGDSVVINRFHHFSELMTPAVKSAMSANVDTLLSIAWIDLSVGPLILRLPDTQGRYYVVQVNDSYSNSFAYIGQRATGTQEQSYLLAGPDWRAGAPPGMRVIRSPTNGAFIVARFLVNGESDVGNVASLQRAMSLEPTVSGAPVPGSAKEPAISKEQPTLIVAKMDAMSFFASMVHLMQLYPPPERDAAMLDQFRNIGIDLDHAFNPAVLEPHVLRGLERATKAGEELLRRVGPQLSGSTLNRWWTPGRAGDFGTDYVTRAYMAMDFIWPNVPEETVYSVGSLGPDGKSLTGAHRYVLRFEKGQTPPVDAFWSLTMFDAHRSLVENSIHRYSIGSRTAGLKYDGEGQLSLFIQADVPRGHESNWLPSPKREFVLTMRMYLPRREILNGTYHIPALECLDCGDVGP
jgi:hypothetical protein